MAARPSELLLVIVLAMMAGIGSVGVDTLIPGFPSIAIAMRAPIEQVQLSISVFFLGIALAPLLYGPLSDRYGRAPILTLGLTLFLIAVIGCATSEGIEGFLAFRLLQGMGAGAASFLARAVVRDLYGARESARVLSLMQALTGVMPIVSPVIGGYLLLLGWQSVFWLMAGYGTVCMLAFNLLIKETRPAGHAQPLASAFSGYWQILSDHSTLGYMFSGGAAFGGLFAFIGGSAFVFIELFKLTPQTYGLLVGLTSTGLIGGAYLGSRMVSRFGLRTMQSAESAICAIIGTATFLVAQSPIAGPWTILPLAWIYLAVINAIAANSMGGTMARFAERAGAASAMGGLVMFGSASSCVWIVSALHDGTATPFALVMMCGGVGSYIIQRLLITRGE